MRIGSQQDLASEFGGTFVSTESGARGDNVLASYFCCEEQRQDEERLNRSDRLRHFVPTDEIEDVSSDDMSSGPRFVALPKGMSLEQAVEKLLRFSPLYAIRLYEWAGARGRFDVLNLLPMLVMKLKVEGIYSREIFQQTPVAGGFSAYRVLRGQVADEHRIIGTEGGIACRIMETLGAF
ncbi:MAG: hypothetical protein Q7S43_01400 [bacterium]|nr:hypothetical protein [bacterium]